MAVDIEKFKAQVREAIERGQAAKFRMDEEKRLAEEQRVQREIEERVERVIGAIPMHVEDRALKGETHAIAMSLESSDFVRPSDALTAQCLPEWLVGAAKIVFESCDAAGFAPTIEFVDDAAPDKGFNIVIYW